MALGFWDRIKYLLTDPVKFFTLVKSDKGIKDALLTYVIVSLFFSVISMLMQAMMNGMMYSELGVMFSPWISISMFVITILISFIYAGLMHLIILACRGKGTYVSTYNVFAYSIIPFLVLSFFPLVGWLSIFYSIVLIIIGLSIVHNISKVKAAIACLLPAIFLIGILIILVIIALRQAFTY